MKIRNGFVSNSSSSCYLIIPGPRKDGIPEFKFGYSDFTGLLPEADMVSDNEISSIKHNILESDEYKNIEADLAYAQEHNYADTIACQGDRQAVFQRTAKERVDAKVLVLSFHDLELNHLFDLLRKNKVIEEVLRLYP